VARVPVSRKQTRMLAVMVSATDMSGHVGVLFMAWLEIMGELAATTKVVDMMLHAVSLGRLASIDCWVQPTRIVAHLSAVVRAPFASTLDCPGPSFPLVFFAGAGRFRLFPTTQALLLVNFVSSWFETHPCRVCRTNLSPNGEGVCTSHTPQGMVLCPRRITCRLVTAHAHAHAHVLFLIARGGLRKSRGCRGRRDEARRH
jgi:hypothetical protein